MSHALPAASAEAELLELLDRLFDATIDRILRFQGRRPRTLCHNNRDDVRQETCARWFGLLATGWTPPPHGAERDDFFIRLVGRSNYHVNRPLLPGVLTLTPHGCGAPGLEPAGRGDPAEHALLAESVASLRSLPFAAGALLALLVTPSFRKGKDRPNLRKIAQELGCEVRTVRLQMHVILERLGTNQRYTRFWLRRVADALFCLARNEIAGNGNSRLACEPEWTAASAAARLRRSLGFLTHAAVSAGERRALGISRRVVIGEVTGAKACLDAVHEILGPSATLHLWQAEEARAAGELERAGLELERAEARASSPEEWRAVWLSRARLAEMEGRYALGLAALAHAETSQRDAVVHYDRMVLLALTGQHRERDAAVSEIGSLHPRDRKRCRGWTLADQGPFALRLLAEPELRRNLLVRLA